MPTTYVPRSFGGLLLLVAALITIAGFTQSISHMAACHSSAFNTSIIASGPLRWIGKTICRFCCISLAPHFCFPLRTHVAYCCSTLFLPLSLLLRCHTLKGKRAVSAYVCCTYLDLCLRRERFTPIPRDMPIGCSMSMRFTCIKIAIILPLFYRHRLALIGRRFTQISGTKFSLGFFRVFQTKHIFRIFENVEMRFQCIKIMLLTWYQIFSALNMLHNFKVQCVFPVFGIGTLKMNIVMNAFLQLPAMETPPHPQIRSTTNVKEVGVKEEDFVDTRCFGPVARKHSLNCLSFSALSSCCQGGKATTFSQGLITPLLGNTLFYHSFCPLEKRRKGA